LSGAPGGQDRPGKHKRPDNWHGERATSLPTAFDRRAFSSALDWAAALELTIATHGAEPYKSRLKELFPE
jgi:endoglucanase